MRKTRIRFLVGFLIACYLVSTLEACPVFADSPDPKGEAPSTGMTTSGRWSSAIKQAFGTAYEAYDVSDKYTAHSATAPISKVWFTAHHGALSEIYWPNLDGAQVQYSEFVVTDGSTFAMSEREAMQTSAKWVSRGVPAFLITSRDPLGRFEIQKTVFTDPDRDVVLESVRFIRRQAGLKLYLLHKPAAGNTALGDSARVSLGSAPGQGLYAWQGSQAQVVVSSTRFVEASAGFQGSVSDPAKELMANFSLRSSYETATSGNVLLAGRIGFPESVGESTSLVAIAFGATPEQARAQALDSLQVGAKASLSKYVRQWQNYQARLRDLSSASLDGGALFRASVALIKSMEDKTLEGAFIASPTLPWGQHHEDKSAVPYEQRQGENMEAGYHAVWPRDLYQMATSFLAIGDARSAVASLNHLRRIQLFNHPQPYRFWHRTFPKDGSFPQCSWIDGRIRWGGLQLDETAFPVMLAYRLWKGGHINGNSYWKMVQSAADFIVVAGPWSHQERWEEAHGASPSTIATEISALWLAAEFADHAGDLARAKKYRETADAWNSKPGDNLEAWTFTTTGKYGTGKYYERVEGASDDGLQHWDPNDDIRFKIANNGAVLLEKEVTDGGFLELVRYGVRSATDPHITESLLAYDQTIRSEVPGHGPGFRRYFGDRYGYDDADGSQTDGMPWPLLTGERAQYELARAKALGTSPAAMLPYLTAMERFATPELMLPEQVWDSGPRAGQSTGSATPLGWSHGEYIKLLRSRKDGQVFDTFPSVVARRKLLEALGSAAF